MEVTVYTTPTCSYCHQLKKFLSQRNVIFTEYDVASDRAAAEEMMRKSGQMGVPVTILDGQVIVGFDRPRLEQLLSARSHSHRPSLGLQVADAGKIAQKHGVIPTLGAYVGGVRPSSPGYQAGLREGDIIIEVNLRPVSNAQDLEQAVQGLASGHRVQLIFLRGPETLRAEVVL